MMLMTFSFFMYLFSNHPMMIASMVISQCIFMASLISKKMVFSWFGFFIFIIYLGGILMLFSYIISLINSTEKIFKMNKFLYLTLISSFFFFLIKEEKSFLELSTNKFTKMIMSMYSLSSMKMSIYLMFFLPLIMVMVVFMTEMSKGTMRKI
uniref:NADH dehydrogenase subunit 6 n=1 Tax=Thrips imaginis TaxID=159957 RepID=Q8HQ07_THRIM|nr:NADH dehydrogenase subunit 6 [Thrips imaginis]